MNKLSKLLLKASWIGSMAEAMLLPMWALLVKRVGGDLIDAGAGYAIFCIATGIAVMGVGRTEWFTRHVKAIVFWGFTIAGICEFSYLFVYNILQLFLLQSLIGVSVGLLGPAWDSLYALDTEEPAKKWSFWSGGQSFLTGIAALLGGFILKSFGWTALFIVMGLIDLISVYYAYALWKTA